jgi:hypothetical protein
VTSRSIVTIRMPDDLSCELVVTCDGKAEVYRLSYEARVALLMRLHESLYRHLRHSRAHVVTKPDEAS